MYRAMTALALAAMMAVSGCATEGGLRKQLDTWVGAPEDRLIAQMGAPSRTYQTGEVKYLTFSNRANMPPMILPGTSTTTFSGGVATTTTMPGQMIGGGTVWCDITFSVIRSYVTGYSYRGNNCRY